MGVSDATFYWWREKYGGLGPLALRRLRQLEEESNKLKRLVADLSLDKAMLHGRIKKGPEVPGLLRWRPAAQVWALSASLVKESAKNSSAGRPACVVYALRAESTTIGAPQA